MNLPRWMLEAVAESPYEGDDPDGDFAEGALCILTGALGKMPEARREAALRKIERGELRDAVDTFVARCAALRHPSPYPRTGNGHAA